MPRRKDKKARDGQHSKGHARPRKWHLSQSQGHKNERMMKQTIEPAFAAADDDRQVVERTSREHRSKVRDHEACMEQIERAAPFVPRLEVKW